MTENGQSIKINNIKIFNQLGQNILVKEIKNNKTILDLSYMNSGIYNIIIETEDKIINKIIIKE